MTDSLPVLVVQMGSPPGPIADVLGDQGDWFRAALAPTGRPIRIVRPDRGEALPAADSFSSAIVTGSWDMVTDRLDWSERTGQWLADLVAAGKPVLGVCYGHQLLADVLGGRVDYLAEGRETGTTPVTLSAAGLEDPVAQILPAVFPAQLTHQQGVLAPPPGATVLAGSARDGHQILRYGPRALSVQFHPEFTESHMRTILGAQQEALGREGRDGEALVEAVGATPAAASLLPAFVSGALDADR